MKTPKGKVQTVLGPVLPSELGFVQPHEHFFLDLRPPGRRDDPGTPMTLDTLDEVKRNWEANLSNLILDSLDEMVDELKHYKALGGGTMVDQTVLCISPQPEKLHRLSLATGVHIVLGTGIYHSLYHTPEVKALSRDEITRLFMKEITEGFGQTDIKAGLIGEIASNWPMEATEEKILRAAVDAQKETGTALSVHPGRDPKAPFHIIRILKEEAADLERIAICHISRTVFDDDSILEIARSGVMLSFDLFGNETSYYPNRGDHPLTDSGRVESIQMLIEAGFLNQIIVSQDICKKHSTQKYGGEGFTHLIKNVLPLMRRKGLSEKEIVTLSISNPARFLTIR